MTDAATILQQATDRNAPAVLAVGVGGLVRLSRSRLLALADDGVWAMLPAGAADAIDAMIRAGDALRVNFKDGPTSIEFHARVLERRRAYRLNPTTLVEAVRLARPAAVKAVQRRAAYRVGLSKADDMRLRFWRISDDADLTGELPPEREMTLDVHDFSPAGAGGVWKRRRGEPPVLGREQRLRVDVTAEGRTVTLEATVRFLAALPEPEYRRIGVQFMLNPMSATDRTNTALLARVAGELQRAELKRLKVAR